MQRYLRLLVFTGVICIVGCDDSPDSTPSQTTASPNSQNKEAAAHQANYDQLYIRIGKQGALSLQNSLSSAKDLSTHVELFLTHSTPENWQQLQQQWTISHQQWHHSDIYLQLLNPSHELNTLRLNIHSRDVTEGYLDSVEGHPYSGIVNDSTLPLNLQTISEQHRRYSNEETAIGIHVLEYFLWARAMEDYIAPSSDKASPKRRRVFLALLAQQWQNDIETALHYWQQQTETPLAPHALKLTLQQKLGSLSNDQHCRFSSDSSWHNAEIAAISPLLEHNDEFKQLQNLVNTRGYDADALHKSLGAAMLSLTLQNH